MRGAKAASLGIGWLVTAFVLLSAAVAQPSPDALPHRLFREGPAVEQGEEEEFRRARERSANDGPEVVRFRPVRVNLDGLLDREVITVSLFDGEEVRAVLDRVERSNHIGGWIGHIEGDPLSQVSLAGSNGVISGTIQTLGEAYVIRFVGDGLHVLQQIDLTAMEVCGNRPEDAPESKAGEAPRPNVSDSLGTAGEQAGAPALTAPESITEIDVLVVYTDAARDGAHGDVAMQFIIQNGIQNANQAYISSNVQIHLNWTWLRISYAETGNSQTDVNNLTAGGGPFALVHYIRDSEGWDLVQLVTEQSDACGRGHIERGPDLGFSVVKRSCYDASNNTAAHEIGHNLGSDHDHANKTAGNDQAHSYSFGHRKPGFFHTVMSYDCRPEFCPGCAPCNPIRYFSNPFVNDPGSGLPTGIPEGRRLPADNARSMNNTRSEVAGYRYQPRLPGTPVPVSPSGKIATTSPTYLWNTASDARDYRLVVSDRQFNIVDQWYPADPAGGVCGATQCSVTPDTVLSDGGHSWWVQAANARGEGSASNTLGFTVATGPPPPPPEALTAGETLLPDQEATSADGSFHLVYQGSDGNLVLYNSNWVALWSSCTAGTSPGQAVMQGDGNFVISDGGGGYVADSGTAGNPGAWLVVQNDGNVVIYSPGWFPLWDRFSNPCL